MSLAGLPTEILFQIGADVGLSRGLSSLARVSYRFNAIFNPLLYQLLQLSDGGRSALFWAARANNALVASHLLGVHKVDVMSRETSQLSYSPTALHVAAQATHLDVVQVLLAHGADVNDDAGGRYVRPYHIAKMPVLEVLLDAGADIEANVRANDLTPLCCAAHHQYDDGVRYLLSRGADPNRNVWIEHLAAMVQTSPLYYAAVPWRQRAVEDLIAYGADVDRAIEMLANMEPSSVPIVKQLREAERKVQARNGVAAAKEDEEGESGKWTETGAKGEEPFWY